MENYKLIRVVGRKNKEGKDYFLGLVLLNTDSDSEVIRILLKNQEQANKLNEALKDNNFNIEKYMKVTYNTFQKTYQPSITYGL